MDYEKKYNDLVDGLKELWNCHTNDSHLLGELVEICPELADSEDERIMKDIMLAVGNWFHYKRVEEIRAYLEKQKDASKAIEAVDRIDKYIDKHLANAHDMKDSNPDKKYYRGWDDALGKMAGILQDVYSEEKRKEQKPQGVYVDCTEHPEWYGMPAKEQKPADRFEEAREKYQVEWSGEDWSMLSDISLTIKHSGYDSVRKGAMGIWLKSLPERFKLQPKQEWSEEDEDMFNDILLDMADRREMFKSKGETTFAENTQKKIDWLDSHHLQLKYQSSCPQPKQEWSEEDEKIINNIVSVLGQYIDYKSVSGTGTGYATPRYGAEISWLKSLRPSWKPSEEQMEALDVAATDYKELDELDVVELRMLYNDLKKLI